MLNIKMININARMLFAHKPQSLASKLASNLQPPVAIAVISVLLLLLAFFAFTHQRKSKSTTKTDLAEEQSTAKNPHGYKDDAKAGMCPFMHGTVHTCPYPGYKHGTHPEVCPLGCQPCAPCEEEPDEKLQREAREFMTIFAHETGRDKDEFVPTRMAAVEAEVRREGTYELTHEELEFGAQLAWRNAPKCANRAKYRELSVMDCRKATTNDAAFEAMLSLVDAGISSGGTVTRMAVFRPKASNETQGPRVWNSMLLRYAGYRMADGSVLGDPADADFTETLISQFGWVPPSPRSAWDVLPLLIQLDENSPPELYELPESCVPTVPIRHPTRPGFDELRLRWFGLPLVCGMEMTVGGLSFTCAPFLGWFADYEVVRNLTDPGRLDLCASVASAIGIDTSPANELWKDQALLAVNEAVVSSFRGAGFAMVSRHTMLSEFMGFYEGEKKKRGFCPVNWKWVIPPWGGTLSAAYNGLAKSTEFTLLPAILPPRVNGKPAGWRHYALGEGLDDESARKSITQIRRARCIAVKPATRWHQLRSATMLVGGTLALMHQRPVLVIAYATVSGTARRKAERLAALLDATFLVVTMDLAHLDVPVHAPTFRSASLVLIVTSTYGSGAPPPSAARFLKWTQSPAAIDTWRDVPFAVLGLGSSAYPRFCAAADVFVSSVSAAGGSHLVDQPGRIDALGEGEATFQSWLVEVTDAYADKLLAELLPRTTKPQQRRATVCAQHAVGRRQLRRQRSAPRAVSLVPSRCAAADCFEEHSAPARTGTTKCIPAEVPKVLRSFVARFHALRLSLRASGPEHCPVVSAGLDRQLPYRVVRMLGAPTPPTPHWPGACSGTVLATTRLVDQPAGAAGSLPRSTVKLTIDASSVPGGILYQPGDNVAVYPRSAPARVVEAARAYGVDESELGTVITLQPRAATHTSTEAAFPLTPPPFATPATLRDALTIFLDHEARPTFHSLQHLRQVVRRRTDDAHEADAAPPPAALLATLTQLTADRTGGAVEGWLAAHAATTWPALFDALPGLRSAVAIDELCQLIPTKHPRYYSIASSRHDAHHPGAERTFELLVGLQGTTAHPGQASAFLHALQPGDSLDFRVVPVPAFHLPLSPCAPCVCICAGTGFAPLRGFLQLRGYQMASREQIDRRNWSRRLALRSSGARRSPPTDDEGTTPPSVNASRSLDEGATPRRAVRSGGWTARSSISTLHGLAPMMLIGGYRTEGEVLCADEVRNALESGALTEAHFAISRPTPPAKKRYVQDLIAHDAALGRRLRELLANPERYPGATVFVCGEANMAAAVAGALEKVLGPTAYAALHESGHYHEEIFGASKR